MLTRTRGIEDELHLAIPFLLNTELFCCDEFDLCYDLKPNTVEKPQETLHNRSTKHLSHYGQQTILTTTAYARSFSLVSESRRTTSDNQ